MIRILHLITSLNTGGAEMMLFKLLSRINRNQFENKVISLIPPGPVGKKIDNLNIPISHLGMKQGMISPIAIFKLAADIKKYNPNLVQTWMYHSDLLGYLSSRLAGNGKVIWNIRCSNMELSQYSRVTAWTIHICKKLSSFPHAVITNSHTAKADHLLMGYHPKRFQVIPNGFDLSQFEYNESARIQLRQELNLDTDTMCIGLIARYDPKKDHATFLKAIKDIVQTHAHCRFILCGEMIDSHNNQLTQLIHELKIDSFVHLLGRRDDMAKIMSAMDVLVLSSSFGEGFPNVIGEAMACEVPCVVTNVGDSALIVGDTGKVVEPRDPQALSASIKDLLDASPEFRRKLGKEARERIASHYSLEKVVETYEDLYRSSL